MENNKKIINIDELERISQMLFSKLKENIGNEIEVNKDFYWNISEEELYNPYDEPSNMTLGQLSDDIERINYVYKFSDEIVNYDLKRLSTIIQVLSLEVW